MEKRALLAFVLSMGIFALWMYFFSPQTETPVTPKDGEIAATTTTAPEEKATPVAGLAPVAAPDGQVAAAMQPAVPARDITVRTKLYTAVLTESGGRLKSLTLNQYRATNNPDSPPMELVNVADSANWPLGVYFEKDPSRNLKTAYFKADRDEIVLNGEEDSAQLTMTYQGPDGFQVVRTYRFQKDSYLIEADVNLRNLSPNAVDDNLVLEAANRHYLKSLRYSFAGLGAVINGELHEIKLDELEEGLEGFKTSDYSVQWAGYEDQYFLTAVLPGEPDKTRLKAESYGQDNTGVKLRFVNPPLVMPAGTQKEYKYKLFYGPKDYYVLKSTGHDLGKSIYFGWFDILSKPLLMLMVWLHRFVGNYGIVIIIITILIKILFWPLTAKSYRSMKGMQKLQPKIMKLREKYKGDREAMNREMMQLYRTFKVNPMGGCLPMVIQIPVFIALYRLLDYSLELRHTPFWLWINDLSAPDRLFQFAFKIPLMQEPSGIPVLTLLMGATMFLQQKMTPTPGDPTQAKIMMLMPIFFTFIFINFPSGLVLYWLVNNVLSIGQQYMINRSPS